MAEPLELTYRAGGNASDDRVMFFPLNRTRGSSRMGIRIAPPVYRPQVTTDFILGACAALSLIEGASPAEYLCAGTKNGYICSTQAFIHSRTRCEPIPAPRHISQ